MKIKLIKIVSESKELSTIGDCVNSEIRKLTKNGLEVFDVRFCNQQNYDGKSYTLYAIAYR